MNNQEFEQIVEQINTQRTALMRGKTHDYDLASDRLASFKQVAAIAKVLQVNCHTGSGIATVLLILKMVRDANLKSSGTAPSNESRNDTVIDWHNYIDLKLANEHDEAIEEAAKAVWKASFPASQEPATKVPDRTCAVPAHIPEPKTYRCGCGAFLPNITALRKHFVSPEVRNAPKGTHYSAQWDPALAMRALRSCGGITFESVPGQVCIGNEYPVRQDANVISDTYWQKMRENLQEKMKNRD
jgi:hypothetical protein